MEVICIKKPESERFIRTDVTIGKTYKVGFDDDFDYQLIDDNKKMSWYSKKYFKPLNP